MLKNIYKYTLLFGVSIIVSCSVKPSLIVTEADMGKKIEVMNNSIFAIKLKGQMGTGFSWKIVSENPGFELIGQPEVITSGEKKTGGFDYQIFNFKATKAGESELRFHYKQSWKKGVKPNKTFNIIINIKDDKGDKSNKK